MISIRGARAVAAAIASVTICLAPSAHADHESSSACGDFGGLAVMIGGGLGLGAAAVSALTFPAIAGATTPGLKYWPGAGYTVAGGTAGVVGSVFILAKDCPRSTLWVPSAAAVSMSLLTTVIWASASKQKQPAVSLHVGMPRTGQGLSVTLLGSL